ncbi:type IV secretion system DNA-binding domain-containing protein [Candidatus Woesebacteria bacterium]|nr:type IV secretion system DNA-binding domain-containing protein [Candidatus Woesebacteria bacterium]
MDFNLGLDELVARLIFFGIVVLGAIIAALLTAGFTYLLVIYIRLKKREQMAYEMVTLQIMLPKDNEIKIDAAEQMFASFASLKKGSGWFSFLEISDALAFEIVGTKADIKFYVSAPNKIVDLIEKTIYGYYPSADIKKVEEPNIFTEHGKVAFSSLKLSKDDYFPLKTFREIPNDSLAAITATISKMDDEEGAMIQFLIRGADSSWKKAGKSFVSSTKKKEADPNEATFETSQKSLERVDEKSSKTGFETMIRIVVTAKNQDTADAHLRNIKNAFSQFDSEQNELTSPKIWFKSGFMMNFIYKFFPAFEMPGTKLTSILSVDELASMFHFPNKTVETPNVQWLKAKTAPVSAEVPMTGGTFIGHGYYRGVRRPVNLHLRDRMRHMYIIGKTGVGKSELLKEMIKQDIADGKGVCVIDPHGDLIDDTLRYIPPERAEDVILFDPSETERPMGLNLLEAQTEEQKHFITGAIINLMYKLYDPQRTGIIGPRFEHAVRNAMLTIMCEEGSTFIEIVRVMTDQKFVQELLPKVKDPIIRRYWTDQIAQTSDFHKSEVLDYIVSKFGRFVTNKMMRNIIGQSKSSFDFRKVMDDGKILLINLSKGKLGEENSTFLGLLIIPKILAAAMSRVDTPEENRRDFFLYVDEFQNFATPDFAVILSEARKYHLSLTVANQFIGQMDEEVKNAVFGNVGTMVSFRVGVTDASYLAREFQPRFNESDLINIERFHGYMKTIVNNEPVEPFSVDMTKDMDELKAGRNEKIAQAIIQLSKLKFGKPVELVEAAINQRARL